MRSNDPQDWSEDFEPAPLAIGPDGGIEMTEQAKIIPPPPRLCEAGPCRHYHRFVIQMDAEAPRGQGVGPGGKIIGLPEGQPFHVSTHHYCYPALGIETELGALPVLECNFWDPMDYGDLSGVKARRETFLKSLAGEKFTEERAAWRKSLDEQATVGELDEVQRWIALNMRDGDVLGLHRSDGSWLTNYRRDEADALSLTYLESTWGPGCYELQIDRHETGIHTKKVEVI